MLFFFFSLLCFFIYSKELEVGLEAVREAGNILAPFFGKPQEVSYKEGKEIVTEMDLKAEQKIKEICNLNFPDYAFLGEEQGKDNIDSEYLWITDALDGTLNYSRGIFPYGVSLALAKNREVVLGIVFNPITNELFHAVRGKGAFLNNNPISVSNVSDISKSIIYSTEIYRTFSLVSSLSKNAKHFRITSSSAYDTCLIACGRAEAYIKVTSHPWGFAAANLIVEEAGGKITDLDKKKWNIDSKRMIISNFALHFLLLEELGFKDLGKIGNSK